MCMHLLPKSISCVLYIFFCILLPRIFEVVGTYLLLGVSAIRNNAPLIGAWTMWIWILKFMVLVFDLFIISVLFSNTCFTRHFQLCTCFVFAFQFACYSILLGLSSICRKGDADAAEKPAVAQRIRKSYNKSVTLC